MLSGRHVLGRRSVLVPGDVYRGLDTDSRAWILTLRPGYWLLTLATGYWLLNLYWLLTLDTATGVLG